MIAWGGQEPVSTDRAPAARTDSTAPPAVMIAPDSPEAVPARSGRTEMEPAIEFGSVIPFPRPSAVQKPKNTQGLTFPASVRRSDTESPSVATAQPIIAIR